jgi:hypothetical protein
MTCSSPASSKRGEAFDFLPSQPAAGRIYQVT